MTIGEIECFLAICRFQSISRAADYLYISQPTLSVKLKTLERELGGTLFYRHNGMREMQLTPAGKAFYELALQHDAIIKKMLRVCKNQRQVLRVSSLNSLGNYLLPKVYDRFMQFHPEVELQIQDMEAESACRSLLAGTTDIAFISGITNDENITQAPLLRESMVVICSDSAPISQAPDVQELTAHQELYIEWSNAFAQWHRKTIGQNHPQLTVSIMAHLRQFLDAKPRWAIVPASVAQGLQRECSMRILESSFPLPFREISLLNVAGKETEPAAAAFLNCLKKVLAQHPGLTYLL